MSSSDTKSYLVYCWHILDEGANCTFIAVYSGRAAAKKYVSDLVETRYKSKKDSLLSSLEYYHGELQRLTVAKAAASAKPERYELGLQINTVKEQLQICEQQMDMQMTVLKDVDAAHHDDDDNLVYSVHYTPVACRDSIYVVPFNNDYYCVRELPSYT